MKCGDIQTDGQTHTHIYTGVTSARWHMLARACERQLSER